VFGLAYAWDLYRERRVENLSGAIPQARLAAGIFASALVLVMIILWPAHDLKPPVSPELTRFIHEIAPAAYHPDAPRPILLRASAVPSASPSTAPPPVPSPLALNLGMGALKIRDRLSTVFIYPIASFAPLAILFQALVFLLVWRRGHPTLIAGPLLLGAFIVEVYLRLWHTSLVWVALIMLLWAVWDERETITRGSLRSWSMQSWPLQNCVGIVFAVVCLLQLPWTAAALRFEWTHPTYPAQAAADYLKSLPRGTRVDGFDHAFTLAPYFEDYYPFHLQQDVLDVPAVLADRPQVILFRDSTVSPAQFARLILAGYEITHDFCGTPFFPNQPLVPLCLVVLEKP
jgi:hypothetical protein